MKAVALVWLLAVCSPVVSAQTIAAPSGDVTIEIDEGTPEYCLGSNPALPFQAKDPAAITLRLPLKVQYENHRADTIYLPPWVHYSMRMTVAGQQGASLLRNASGGGLDVRAVMAMPRPDALFLTIAGERAVWAKGFEGIAIPVVDHSRGLDIRGKTVQLVMTRDFRSLAPDVVEKLNQKWKDYGTVWTGVVESNTMIF